MQSAIYHIEGLRRAVGIIAMGSILLRRLLRLRSVIKVRVPRVGKLAIRPLESDLFVLSQIFGWEEYRVDEDRLVQLNERAVRWEKDGLQPLIIDAGANVGFSSLYLSQKFPKALVLAIEPDCDCFEILCRNVERRPNIKAFNLALWSHDRGLRLQRSTGGSWANQMREGEGTPSERLDALVAAVSSSRVLLIKMDIEGAERTVVESCPQIFAEARCIMIEPHDFCLPGSSCLAPLYRIVGDGRHDTILNGENIIFFAVDSPAALREEK